MITLDVTIGDTVWAITGDDRPNALAPAPAITAIVNGVAVDIDCQYRQINAIRHASGCTWGTRIGAVCTCAPQPDDPDRLFSAARDVFLRCCDARTAAEQAEEAARQERQTDTVYVRLLDGCEGCPSALYSGVCTCC